MSIQFRRTIYRPLSILLVSCTLFAQGLSVLPAYAQATSTLSDTAGGAYEGVEVVLHVDAAPAPGGTANFTFTATPLRDAPDLTLTWELPDGGVLLGGPAGETFAPMNGR